MTIRQIIFTLAALLLLSLALLSYQFYNILVIGKINQEVNMESEISVNLAIESYIITDELTRAARTYVATGDKRYKDQYYVIRDIREGRLERPVDYPHLYWGLVNGGVINPRPGSGVTKPFTQILQESGFSNEELQKIDESFKESKELTKLEERAFNMIETQDRYRDDYDGPSVYDTAIKMLYDSNYHKAKLKILKPIDEFVDLLRIRLGKQVEEAQKDLNMATWLFLLFVVLAFALIGALAYFVREDNQRQLRERLEAQRKVEDENERMNDSVINILEAVNSLSEGDLTAHAPVSEDIIGTVSDSINALSSETAHVLWDVNRIAKLVADISNNLRRQAGQVTATAEEEREEVKKTIETLLDVTQAMNQVSALADQSAESAEKVTSITNTALVTVEDSVKGINSVRDVISETEKRIKRLGERSQEISGIVNLIDTISERTHVLALNASMQAAVAGEAGRGFAVVAEEVQRLAESSRNATQQIATLVNNIQIETNEAINTVNQTIEEVVYGSQNAQKAGEQMIETQQVIEQLVGQVREITAASSRQKEMSGVLLEAMQLVGENTEKTAQQIEEQNLQTDSLLQVSSDLVESISVFKLPQRAADAADEVGAAMADEAVDQAV